MVHRFLTLLTVILACQPASSIAPQSFGEGIRSVNPAQREAEVRARIERCERAEKETRPAFHELTSPTLSAALASSETLWSFLVAPETPYPERYAAATQGDAVLPFAFLPRLMAALGQLRREGAIHHWGLHPHPLSSVHAPGSRVDLDKVAPARSVLGRTWSVPSQRSEFPLFWQEECDAPWPWQVEQALTRLYWNLAPRGRTIGSGWHEAALEMPWSTEEEALLFVEATGAAIHSCTLPVLARWRSIALHPGWSDAPVRVARQLADVQRLWLDPRSGEIAALLALDVLGSSPDERARHEAAWSIGKMGTQVLAERKGTKDLRNAPEWKLPPLPRIPDSLLLQLGRKGLDLREGDEWTRLHVHVFSLCQCLESPPIAVDRRMSSKSPEVRRSLDAFAEWFRARETELERSSADEQRRWTELRELLDASAKR